MQSQTMKGLQQEGAQQTLRILAGAMDQVLGSHQAVRSAADAITSLSKETRTAEICSHRSSRAADCGTVGNS